MSIKKHPGIGFHPHAGFFYVQCDATWKSGDVGSMTETAPTARELENKLIDLGWLVLEFGSGDDHRRFDICPDHAVALKEMIDLGKK